MSARYFVALSVLLALAGLLSLVIAESGQVLPSPFRTHVLGLTIPVI